LPVPLATAARVGIRRVGAISLTLLAPAQEAGGQTAGLTIVATRSYSSFMKAVNLRELKNRLGGYVREVRAGEVILVTDRGEVVAELRSPLHDARSAAPLERSLERLAREGKVRLGLPNTPEAYAPSAHRVRDGLVERLIDEERAGL